MSQLPFLDNSMILDEPICLSNLVRMFEEFDLMKLKQQDLEEQLQWVKIDNEAMKLKLHQTEEKVNLLEQKLLQLNIMSNDHEAPTLEERRLTLEFKNGPSPLIYTGKEIKADCGASLELKLVDADSGMVVDSGPVANSEVEIVVLEGDDGNADNWTAEEFNNRIVGERKGTKLGGNVTIKLNNGIGVIDDIKFVSSATHMPQGVFKLGARTVGKFSGIHVREGKTDSFTVEDFRNECYKKHEIPELSDGLYRLKNISPKGKILKRLQERKISCVKDFLVQLFKDPEELKEMVGLQKKKWEETVKNAQNCLKKRLCYYIDPDTNMKVVFSFVDQVIGVVASSHYIPISKLPFNEQENARKLAIRALDDWDNVHFANDVASILDSMDLSIPIEQENPIELELEASGSIGGFGDPQIDSTAILQSNDYGFSTAVSEVQPAAHYDHISLTNSSVNSPFFQGAEHPKCLEIAPFEAQGTCGGIGFYPTSSMNLSINHDMVMPNVMRPLQSSTFEDFFRGIASSSSSTLFVDPLKPQDEAIAHFDHWNNIQQDAYLQGTSTWMTDEFQPFIMETFCKTASSSNNMALVRTIPWKRWLIIAYILSVRWGLLRTDAINLSRIQELLTRWEMVRFSMVTSIDDLAFLNAALSKKPRTQ